jgi:hypothetical protein
MKVEILIVGGDISIVKKLEQVNLIKREDFVGLYWFIKY